MARLFGLIGFPLSHSFSKKFFTEKFQREGIMDCRYELFPIERIDRLPDLLARHPELCGLNVTIPYKEAVIPLLHELDPLAEEAGAVNTIKIEGDKLIGYNTDVYGFRESLYNLIYRLGRGDPGGALVLGTGGAAKAVTTVLWQLEIPFIYVSRREGLPFHSYEKLEKENIAYFNLIINTTPLGMAPNTETCPPIPYEYLTDHNILFDLVYNPEETLFLKRGKIAGCATSNGLEMLYLQAERAWEIWNT